MIDGSRLIAVDADDVCSKYGYFCESHSLLTEAEAKKTTLKWLENGDAYEDYRVKTHCRYICR